MKRLILILHAFLVTGLLLSQKLHVEPVVKMLALGDSYTIGESVAESERWPVQFTEMLKRRGVQVDKLDIIARTGWTTGNLSAAIASTLDTTMDYNLVSLLIGVNNQYQGLDINKYPSEFTRLLETAIKIAGGDSSRVLVLSIPDYAYTPFGRGNEIISEQIDAYNKMNRDISESYGITYVNITDISRKGLDDPDLVASDRLHPSGKQYRLWSLRILDYVKFNSVSLPPDVRSPGFRIYPNPFTSSLQIIGGTAEVDLSIYDQQGKSVIKNYKKIMLPVALNLEYLPSGIYHLVLFDKERIFTDRILKN